MLLIGIFIALVFAYGLVSKRLEGGYLTAPMLFLWLACLSRFC